MRQPRSLQHSVRPKSVFDHPVNTFVASFIGSPATSLVPLTLQQRGDDRVLVGAGGGGLVVSPENARKAQRAKSSAVLLGARHSTIALHTTEVAGTIPCKTSTAEPTGAVTFAQVYLDPCIVNSSLDRNVPIQPDQPVWLAFDQRWIHLFDGQTQQAL